MSHHRFSIVIPTRNRPHTLRFALRTCLAQAFDDFEIVVSDNHSPPSTKELVDSFGARRLRYVRTPEPLSMTDSLEFASSQAAGEYVLFMGDDDGLLLHALSEADRLIRLHGVEVLRWDSLCYNWPDIRPQRQAAPNGLLIPLKQVRAHHPIYRCEAAGMMRAAANSEITYARLPMIYCSAIHHRLLDELRQRSGRVFRSEAPDVYSSFAVAHVAGFFHSLSAPLNIAGLSGSSTGVACLYEKKSPIAEEFRQLNARAKHTRHPWVPGLSVMAAYVADSFLHAKEALFAGDSIDLDRRQLVVNCLRELNAADEEEWQWALEACRHSLADDPCLTAWFDAEQAGRPFTSAVLGGQQAVHKRYGGDYLQLDASDFGVSDTFGVAQLCEKLLGYQRDGINARLETDAPDTSGPRLSELQEKEAVIQVLDKAARERLRAIGELSEEKQRLLGHIAKLESGFFARLLRRFSRQGQIGETR